MRLACRDAFLSVHTCRYSSGLTAANSTSSAAAAPPPLLAELPADANSAVLPNPTYARHPAVLLEQPSVRRPHLGGDLLRRGLQVELREELRAEAPHRAEDERPAAHAGRVRDVHLRGEAAP